MISHRHRFGETFGFVINAPRPEWVDVTPIIFLLRMLERVAVAFRCRCQYERRFLVFREAERVVRPERAHFQRRDW